MSELTTSGQFAELVKLRRAGASVECALRALLPDGYLLHKNQPRDLAELWIVIQGAVRDAALSAEHVQECIAALRSGGVRPRVLTRERQAEVWYNTFGLWMNGISFEQYLADIPEMPWIGVGIRLQFDRDVLCDARIFERIGRYGVANRLNIGNDFAEGHTLPTQGHEEGVYWIRCQDGWRNRFLAPQQAEQFFASCEVGLSEFEVFCLILQDPRVLRLSRLWCTRTSRQEGKRRTMIAVNDGYPSDHPERPATPSAITYSSEPTAAFSCYRDCTPSRFHQVGR